ncbi:MAG TPA: lytic transglycosylase domain-containing protein, partial [Bryobacteraceae bacterium]|nr:lytic transglycosylase domain-containing protein [Bryobacteraceae bacterium]
PLSKEAIEAESGLARLRGILGENFPPVMPQVRLERAARLTRGGQGARARREYSEMAYDFGGAQRDYARVRAAFDSYVALAALEVATPDADAERLFLMHAATRRSKLDVAAERAVEELGRKHATSRWRLLAIVAQANSHLVKNEADLYEPLYRTCYRDFPNEPEAAFCHWKVTWASHMRREGPGMFEEHLRLYPQSEKASAALYFLGRKAELVAQYPLSYYAMLARTQAPARTKRTQLPDFQPSAAMRVRLDRAQILESLEYPEWAEFELQWAAQNEANSFPAAMALAETASRRGAHDVSIRYIKRYAPGYLSIPLEAAPEKFWRLAFPLPYRTPLESSSRERGLDPFLLAALIRQESEFNPKALSSARAYGLTQVLPSTARQISRKAGVIGFTTDRLFEPEVNLKLGSYYLKSLLDQHDGAWEKTLASYNAGKSRTNLWSQWAEYREPAEFIESVPFTETRNYIQIVLRNAEVYRRLYGSEVTGR